MKCQLYFTIIISITITYTSLLYKSYTQRYPLLNFAFSTNSSLTLVVKKALIFCAAVAVGCITLVIAMLLWVGTGSYIGSRRSKSCRRMFMLYQFCYSFFRHMWPTLAVYTRFSNNNFHFFFFTCTCYGSHGNDCLVHKWNQQKA